MTDTGLPAKPEPSPDEEWRAVPGVAGLRVSSLGRVQKDEGWRHGWTPCFYVKPDVRGYCVFTHAKKRCRVHACVAEAFLCARPSARHTPDHIDGNRSNNDVNNLRWATKSTQSINQKKRKTYRSSKAILVRHRDWDDFTPSLWFSSSAAAAKSTRMFSASFSEAARGKATRAGPYKVRYAPWTETQEDLPGEVWKAVDAATHISSKGRACIKESNGEKLCARFTPLPTTGEPYARVRSKDFHVIVCQTFHGNPPSPSHTVDHIDGDTTNNCADNLRWLSKQGQCLNQRLVKGPEFMQSRKGKRQKVR